MRRSIWLGIIVALVALCLGASAAAGVSLVVSRHVANTTQLNRQNGQPNRQTMPFGPGGRGRRLPRNGQGGPGQMPWYNGRPNTPANPTNPSTPNNPGNPTQPGSPNPAPGVPWYHPLWRGPMLNP
jgi:hypothetical protein